MPKKIESYPRFIPIFSLVKFIIRIVFFATNATEKGSWWPGHLVWKINLRKPHFLSFSAQRKWRDYNKQFMTDPKGILSFVRPKPSLMNVKTHCLPWGQSLSVLLYLATQIWETLWTNYLLKAGRHSTFAPVSRCTNWSRANWSSSCCVLRELMSFALLSGVGVFLPTTHESSPPVKKHVWIGR